MPSAYVVAPVDTPIVRYRCYHCGARWWEYLDKLRLAQPQHNTLLSLCDPCEDTWRQHKQG